MTDLSSTEYLAWLADGCRDMGNAAHQQPGASKYMRALRKAEAAIREVLDHREADGWRDISTAPATDDYPPLMLLFVPHDMGGYIFVGTRNVAGNWIDNLVMDEHHPTHWRPLPSTPTTEASLGE